MKVSLNWLKEYVDLPLPVEELVERLNMSGTEVGRVMRVGGQWQNIWVGQVVALEKHPNADRLQLATVDLGQRQVTVVTGAPNLAVGQKVPYAGLGAYLIDGHTGQPTVLKAAKIRGVSSEGMVCSEKELSLSEDH